MWGYKKKLFRAAAVKHDTQQEDQQEDTSRRREKANGMAHGSDWISTHVHSFGVLMAYSVNM